MVPHAKGLSESTRLAIDLKIWQRSNQKRGEERRREKEEGGRRKKEEGGGGKGTHFSSRQLKCDAPPPAQIPLCSSRLFPPRLYTKEGGKEGEGRAQRGSKPPRLQPL